MFYLFVFTLLIFFSFLEVIHLSKKTLSNLHIFVGVMFVLIAGLRYETGVDWRAYQYTFDNMPALDQAFYTKNLSEVFFSLDLGYALLNSVIKMLGGGIQTLFFVVSLASTILLIKNLRYYTEYVLTGLLIYYSFFFFVFDLSGLRQGLAMQIFFYALKYIGEKNFKKFILCLLIATSIHWTAFLLLYLYFFIKNKASVKLTLMIFTIALFVFTFQIRWLGTILDNLLNQLNFAPLLAAKFLAYTTSEIFSVPRGWDLYSVFNFIRMALVIFLSNHFKTKLEVNIKQYAVFYNLVLIEVVLFFCFFEFTEISERLRFYFFLAEIVLISNLVFCFKDYFFRYLTFGVTICILFLNSYPFLLNSVSTIAYHPYQNYWIYKALNLQSDGDDRLEEHKRTHE